MGAFESFLYPRRVRTNNRKNMNNIDHFSVSYVLTKSSLRIREVIDNEQGCHKMRIIHGYSRPNPSRIRIRILFYHIRQYSYPYPKARCGYGYGKSNILSISDPIFECWVLDNDIRMEETILQWNNALNFDILSSRKSNSEKY